MEHLVPLFTAYRGFFNPQADPAKSAGFLGERIRRDEAVIFMARDARGDAHGFVTLYPLWSSWHCRRIWFLSDLYVTPQRRGAGLGRRLVERVKTYAAQTHAASVMVELPRAEPHLYAFYDALEFHTDAVFELARYHPPDSG